MQSHGAQKLPNTHIYLYVYLLLYVFWALHFTEKKQNFLCDGGGSGGAKILGVRRGDVTHDHIGVHSSFRWGLEGGCGGGWAGDVSPTQKAGEKKRTW